MKKRTYHFDKYLLLRRHQWRIINYILHKIGKLALGEILMGKKGWNPLAFGVIWISLKYLSNKWMNWPETIAQVILFGLLRGSDSSNLEVQTPGWSNTFSDSLWRFHSVSRNQNAIIWIPRKFFIEYFDYPHSFEVRLCKSSHFRQIAIHVHLVQWTVNNVVKPS